MKTNVGELYETPPLTLDDYPIILTCSRVVGTESHRFSVCTGGRPNVHLFVNFDGDMICEWIGFVLSPHEQPREVVCTVEVWERLADSKYVELSFSYPDGSIALELKGYVEQ